MDSNVVLSRLAKISGTETPVVSVYLNTRWADEHQRGRARVFLKNELRKARQHMGDGRLEADLAWVQSQGESVIEQAMFPDAHGVAVFACGTAGLREVLPVRVPFDDVFVVGDGPFLRPLAALVEDTPSVLVVFVDGKSARLIPLNARGTGEEVTLESEVPGHHRRGGWAQLAQSRYQRHIGDHRDRHFEAVAEALLQLGEDRGVERVVLAGEPHVVAAFRKRLPQRIAERVAGTVPGARHETASALVARATELLGDRDRQEAQGTVDAVLTEAAKSGRAVAGSEATMDAVNLGAVHRLYLLRGFQEAGRACLECKTIQRDSMVTCRRCGKGTRAVELGEAMVDQVLAAAGTVDVIESHAGLAAVGGMAARLRYPI